MAQRPRTDEIRMYCSHCEYWTESKNAHNNLRHHLRTAHGIDPKQQELAQRNAEHGTNIYLLVKEPEAVALVAGFVPHTIRQQARAAIDWEFHRNQRPLTAALHGVLRTPRGRRAGR
jgi:hypothetical protein